MNKERRARLGKIASAITDLVEQLESIAEEEFEAREALPESIQDGNQGMKMEAASDYMEQAKESLEEAATSIESAQE